MTFKYSWEKAHHQVILPAKIIEAMIALAYPNQPLSSYTVLSGGCANLNIKINLLNEPKSAILRIYLRDKDASFREQNLSIYLKPTVPAPQVYFMGDLESYRFALTEFIPGITLRELLLGNQPHKIANIMQDVGRALDKIQQHHFALSGFFDKNLNVRPSSNENNYSDFAIAALTHPTVIAQLGQEMITNIEIKIKKFNAYFPDFDEKSLVHGDFDPANILVNKIDNTWKITGILDWEFAFSGSFLWDMANMLRYAHHMPPVFEEAFLEGLTEKGLMLPQNWRITTYLLNILSLLDCLVRADPVIQPKQCTDIYNLLSYITQRLDEC